MDVHDVSDTPEYGQALSKLKATLQVASKRKGKQTVDYPFVSWTSPTL